MRRFLPFFLIILLIFVTYFTSFFFKKERSLNENLALRQENQELRAQIQKLAIPDWGLPAVSGQYLKARVLSTYPFNIKNQITINAGEAQGVKISLPATLGENILVGKVKVVFRDTSVIQTLFDPQFELPVNIGEKEVNGLLQGGNEPKVILIEKVKPVAVGDFVYSAGPDFPYGLKIGEIAEIRENMVGIFKEVILKAPFNVGDLRQVNIILGR